MLYYRQHLHIRVTKNHNGPQQIFCRMAVITKEPLSGADIEQAAQTAVETLVHNHYKFTALQLARILSEHNPDWDICLPVPGHIANIREQEADTFTTVLVSCDE